MARADELHEVVPGLYVWQAFGAACKTDLTSTAYVLEEKIIFLDPILLGREPMSELLSLGEPAVIVLTNGNHERASRALAQRWKVPIWSHPEAAAELPCRTDADLADGQVLFGELQVKALPGGGPGEIALYHARTKSLSFGDLVINLPGYEFQVLPEKYCRNAPQARLSLRTLGSLEVRRMTFAHGLPLVQNAERRFAEFVQGLGADATRA
ncbi:MAG TPA: hypothetical protein VGD78_21890 [Chthoniobacterales bacterium]